MSTTRVTSFLGTVAVVSTLLSLSAPRSAAAASACSTPRDSASWTAPLNRRVSLKARQLSLRDALDRVAASARLRLSYSAEAIPLDRRVCLSLDSVAAGDALTSLLAGIGVRLVVIGSDQVVLAPAPVAAAVAEVSVPVVLDRIVVTGSAEGAGGNQRSLPIAIDVVRGRALSEQRVSLLSQSTSGAIPGLWIWEQSPTNLLARYGSIRGASSFGTTYPKIYIDGIQVANPLLVTRIAPNAIDRIEVIRGPQGAALYGADAISGVANIVSRHDSNDGGHHFRTEAGFGFTSSDYAGQAALAQSYGFSALTGSSTHSAGIDIDASGIGAYAPAVYSRQLSAIVVGRQVTGNSILTETFRLFGLRARSARSPLLDGIDASPGSPGYAGYGVPSMDTLQSESLTQYTIGITAKFFPNDRWQHSIVAGVDGYSLAGLPDDRSPVPFAETAALNDARGAAARLTLRGSTVRKFDLGKASTAELTLALEQSALRDRSVVNQYATWTDGPGPGSGATGMVTTVTDVVRWRANTGLSAQLNTALAERWYLTGGLRVERDEGPAGTGRWAALPMLGASWVLQRQAWSLKLRSAYGRGIRWPEVSAREFLLEGPRTSGANSLSPEKQSGIEAGLDFALGRAVTLQVTRFDQTASGLIQRVSVLGDTAGPSIPGQSIAFQLQNVGEIANHGWELQGSLRGGPLALGAAFTQVDSRVRKVAGGYSGDLRPGDRMLEVPERTMSLSATWTARQWSGTLTAYRAMDWINYDKVAVARAFYSVGHLPPEFIGYQLRSFWKHYDGVTHLRASGNLTLDRRVTFTLTGDNLLNQQTGEPDNITVLPGRTLSFGFRMPF